MHTPKIVIKTEGITGTEVYVDGQKIEGVTGIKYVQSYNKNSGLPMLQIELKATNVTLDAKILPTLPAPFSGFYVPISALLTSEYIPDSELARICRENEINLEIP